jgi:tetratricopeptide (TPR) repeat protein
MELPGVNNSNAYVVRALINEQLSRLPGSNPRDLNWEAISYLERAILLDSQDPSRWAYLGSYHREVGLESNILYDTAKALERDADHPAALDERATALANVGEFGQALDVIAHRKSIEPTTGMDGLKTYVLLRVGRYHEALELLNSLIETDSSELWYRESRGLCYHLLDDPKKAAEDYSWIWEKYDPSNTDYLTTYGWAAYNLGKVEQAIEIFKRALEDVPQDGNLYRNLGLCYLVQNDLAQGEEYLNKGIDLAKNVREMDDLLKMDFTEFKKASKEWHAGAQVLQVLDGASDRARKRRSEVERLPSPEEELRTIEPKRAEQTSSWSGIGIDAGLARLYTEQRPSEALAIYRRLQASRDRFPEARVGLGEVLNGELKKGDGYLKERKPDKALEQFSEILDLALELLPNDQEGLAGVRARLSYTFSIMGNSNNAHAAATQALELCRQIGMTEPGEMLGNIWLSLISDVTQGRAFDNDLKSLEESQLNDWLRTELRAARRVLARLFEEPDQLSAQSDQLATR